MKLLKLHNYSTLSGGALIIAGFSVFAKITGLLRDRLLAAKFGAGDITDAYVAAFRLPDFVFTTLVLGAFAAAFVPVFLEHWQKEEDRERALDIASSVLNIITFVMAALAVVGIVFARELVPLIVHGFTGEKLAMTIAMTRVMLSSIVLFAVSNVFTGLLQAWKRFVAFSVAPILYNVGIIVGILWFTPWYGPIGLAWGVVLGAALHLVAQGIAALRAGYAYRFRWHWRDEAVRKIIRLMIPRSLGVGIAQVNLLVTTSITSLFAAGSISVLYLALNLQGVLISIFGVSIAISAFSYLSEAAAQKKMGEFRVHFDRAVRRILFFTIPGGLFLWVLRAQAVRLIYGAGAFDWIATVMTLEAVGWLALAVAAQSLIPLFARSFFALQDTATPLYVSVSDLIVTAGLSYALGLRFGVVGVAAAAAIAGIAECIALYFLLRHKTGDLGDWQLSRYALEVVWVSLLAAAGAYGILQLAEPLFGTHTVFGLLAQTSVAGLVGLAIYAGLGRWRGWEELGG